MFGLSQDHSWQEMRRGCAQERSKRLHLMTLNIDLEQVDAGQAAFFDNRQERAGANLVSPPRFLPDPSLTDTLPKFQAERASRTAPPCR